MTTQKNRKWYQVFDSEEAVLNVLTDQQVMKVMVGNKYVCFTRNGKDFYAFTDKCPHQGKPLVNAECTDKGEVKCPFHQYKFDLTTGRGQGLYLETYPVESREDGIYVGLEKKWWDPF